MLPLLHLDAEHIPRETPKRGELALVRDPHPLAEGVVQRRVAHVLVHVPVLEDRKVVKQRVPDQDFILYQRGDVRADGLVGRGCVSEGRQAGKSGKPAYRL